MTQHRRNTTPGDDRLLTEFSTDGPAGFESADGRLRDLADVEQKLRRASLIDSLTGLANRTFLDSRLQTLLRSASERAGRLYAVLFIDLDNFKYVNYSLGHAMGDRLLVEIARRLTARQALSTFQIRMTPPPVIVVHWPRDSAATSSWYS